MGQMITPATHENPINSPLTTKQRNTFIPAILISLQFVSSILFAENCKKNNDRFVWPGHKKSDLLISNDVCISMYKYV